MGGPLFLGTDVGTFGTKSVIVDASGKILAISFVESDILIPNPGWAEQWPDVWWNAYVESIRGVLHAAKIDPADIVGISISGLFSGAGVPVDKEFKPIRPAII
jgi:xylulokinase